MFLKRLVNGEINSKFILLEDNVTGNADDLISVFIQKSLQRDKDVHLFCFENSPQSIQKKYKLNSYGNIHFHDLFSDCDGWLTDIDIQQSGPTNQEKRCKNLLHYCSKTAFKNDIVVVIDSMSYFMLMNSQHEAYKQLHQLINSTLFTDKKTLTVGQLIGLVHPETLLDCESSLSQLRYLATTCLTIEPERRKCGSNCKTTVHVINRKANGKVLKQVENVWIDSEGCLHSEEVKICKDQSNEESDKPELSDELTTFKLGLGEHEKKARSQLVLPYLKTEATSGGTIYYEPDENDDWDEEDPDDDLDV